MTTIKRLKFVMSNIYLNIAIISISLLILGIYINYRFVGIFDFIGTLSVLLGVQALYWSISAVILRKQNTANNAVEFSEIESIDIENESINKHYNDVIFHRIELNYNKNTRSMDRYFSTITEYVSRANGSILIMDYLSNKNAIETINNQNIEQSQEFAEILNKKYEEYYAKIEDRLRNGVEYIRILQIPTALRIKAGKNNGKEKVNIALDLLSATTFNHISNCWDINDSLFKLYIIPNAFVGYSYGIVDEKYVLSEYVRYDENGVTYPNELYVNSIDSIPEQLDQRKTMFFKGIGDKNPISKYEFLDAARHNLFHTEDMKRYIDSAEYKESVLKRVVI